MRIKLSAAALAFTLIFAPFAANVETFANAVDMRAQDDAPSDAEQGLFTKGQNLFISGQYEQAITVLQDFLKTYPNSVITDLTLLWLGRSYMQTGKLQEAEQVGQRLRAIPDTPFVEIFESELKTSREEAAKRKPSPPAQNPARQRTEPMQTAAVAAVTPTPTPQTVARETAPVKTIVTPSETASANQTRSPSLARRSEGNQERARRTGSRANRNKAQTQRASAPSNSVNAPDSSEPKGTTTRQASPSAGEREIARNTMTSANAASDSATTTTTNNNVTPPVASPSTQPDRGTGTIEAGATPRTSATSNEAQQAAPTIVITIKQVPDLQLALRRAAFAASPGQIVQLPLTVTNTGNKEDQFRLETDLPAEFQPTFSAAQGGAGTEVPIMITPQLVRGGSYDVLLNLRIPDNAPDNQQLSFYVRAASQANHQVYKVADAALTVAAAALVASSDLSQETVMPGETFTQNIAMKNQGSATARGSRVDFVFNPEFELVSANPSPLVYDRASRTAIWNLGEVDSRAGRDITVTLRAIPEALAAARSVGRGTMKTQSLTMPANFDGPSITIGRVPRARIDAVSTGLTATPGDTIYIPFVVRNPSNYPEAYDVRVTAPGAPPATVFADLNGDGLYQTAEPTITQTGQIEPRGGQYPILLRIEIPRTTPDRQQYAYNVVTRAVNANRVASEASTVLTVGAPRVRVRPELPVSEAEPGDTIFYRLVLVNDGAGLAKNLILTEQLPEALEFVSSEPALDAPRDTRRFVWRVNELAPGETAVLKIAVRIKPNITAETTLSPRHTLTYQDGNGNTYQGQ